MLSKPFKQPIQIEIGIKIGSLKLEFNGTEPILLIGENLHLCVLVILCVVILETVFKFTSLSQVARWCSDDTSIQWRLTKWKQFAIEVGDWLHQIRGRMLAQIAWMIWCLKIWWRYLKPMPWNMLEPFLHWWRCGDLVFHMLIKTCMCAFYLD